MTVDIEQRSDMPLITVHFTMPFDPVGEAEIVAEKLQEMLDATEGKVYYIADITALELTFSQLMLGMGAAYVEGSPYADPRMHIYTIASGDMIKMASEAVNTQEQYKGSVRLFATVDEAMADIEAAMKA